VEISDSTILFFILSTFGEGDPSDNTSGLWHWIKNELPSLPDLKYIAFGLGNSNYKHFNKVVDVVSEGLERAGARALLPVARADDALGGTEESFISWKETIFAYFETKLGHTARQSTWCPKYIIGSFQTSDLAVTQKLRPIQELSSSSTSPVQALPISNTRLLSGESACKKCLHVEINISAFPTLSYKTGDHLILWPINPNVEVNRLLGLLDDQHNIHGPISIVSVDGSKPKVASATTLLDMLRYNLEICAPVSRELVGQLAQFAPSEKQALFLQGLATDRDAYQEFKAKHRPNLAKLIGLASCGDLTRWTSLPLSFLIEVLPVIKPRYYSISSSAIATPRVASLTVSLVDTTAGGVASNYLCGHHERNTSAYCLDGPQELLSGGKVYAQLRKSTFKLPALASQPIIMVAAGTGVAPFRAFIQERARLQQIGRRSGKMVLFFGCRHSGQDFLYREEWQDLQKELGEENLVIITAFSRQVPGDKVYVQQRLRENSALVTQLLVKMNANLYICGSAAMAREVGNVIAEVMKQEFGWEDSKTEEWQHSSKRTRKWQEEVWG